MAIILLKFPNVVHPAIPCIHSSSPAAHGDALQLHLMLQDGTSSLDLV